MKKIYKRIEFLGYYQIVGGGIAMAMMLMNFKFSSDGFYLFVLSLYFVLCSFSVFSGILLLKKKYLIGLKSSNIIQFLQILSFVLFGYIYDFAIGIYLRLTTKLTNDTIIGLDFGFFQGVFSKSTNPERIELNINFIAIALVLMISKYYDRIKAELNNQ